jgi:hypothetical protein
VNTIRSGFGSGVNTAYEERKEGLQGGSLLLLGEWSSPRGDQEMKLEEHSTKLLTLLLASQQTDCPLVSAADRKELK